MAANNIENNKTNGNGVNCFDSSMAGLIDADKVSEIYNCRETSRDESDYNNIRPVSPTPLTICMEKRRLLK